VADRRRHWNPLENWYRDLILVIVCIFVYVSVTGIDHANDRIRAQSRRTDQTNERLQRVISRLRAESHARRDQTCVTFERTWQKDVRSLQGTYEYLDNLTPQQRTDPSTINPTIIRLLPKTEADVRAETPPHYCKGKVGLDDSKFEPVPPRPRSLRTTP
jgi:hypothetical protein